MLDNTTKALADIVSKIPGWETPTAIDLHEKKQEMKSVPVSAWDKNKEKLAGAHNDKIAKGYVYVGSEEKEGVLGRSMTNHNYIAKDSSHHAHIMYPSHSLHDDAFALTNLVTKNSTYKHYDLPNDSKKLHEDLDPLQELSDKTLKSYADKSKKDLADKADKKDFGKTNLLHRAHGMQKVKDRLTKSEGVKFSDRFGAAQRLAEKVEVQVEDTEKKTEEVEQIDELSKDTLKSYQGKAMKSTLDLYKSSDPKDNAKGKKRASSLGKSYLQSMSYKMPFDKHGKRNVKKEEVEPLEELSTDTLKSYEKKAHNSFMNTKDKSVEKKRGAGLDRVVNKLEKRLPEEIEPLQEKDWIAGAIKHPGALHKKLGVPEGDKIPAAKLDAAAKKGGVEGKEANLAKTLKGMHHEEKECTPLEKVKAMAKASHKKIRKETIGVAPDNSTGI